MLFNSLEFALFFLIVYSLYLIFDHRKQNILLLAASLFFYGSWDWRFLLLLLFSSTVDYYLSLAIYRAQDSKRRNFFLTLSIILNLVILGVFKYFNFFVSSLERLTAALNFNFHPHFLNIVLPVGISFYTFQELSYTIDVYRKEIIPPKKISDFTLFVSFFPQLVAGPIERATHLLPQVLSPRKITLSGFYEGCYLIFWGLFKKIFIADNLTHLVDPVFTSAPPYDGGAVLMAVYSFAIQIYCDFSGYSDMARGLGRCLGFDIMLNFNLPYLSSNPREFWQRWHISLSTWLKDYLYIPLGGNKDGRLKTYRNLFLTMLLGGLWHGASWVFIIWGIFHGALLILHRSLQNFLKKFSICRYMDSLWIFHLLKIIFFFHVICLGWLIFRAQSALQIVQMINAIIFNFNDRLFFFYLKDFIFFMWVLALVQAVQFLRKDLMVIYKTHAVARAIFYVFCFSLLVAWGSINGKAFIYFQF